MNQKNNYSAKDIEVLEGLAPVRKRPGMYIGGTDVTAYHHLAYEIIDNCMDEVVAGHASEITVELNKNGSLREALENLDKDRSFLTAGNVFTDDQIDAYISLKMEEVYNMEHTPHPIEYQMYYSC